MNARTVMILGLSLGVTTEGCNLLLGVDQEYSPAVHETASSQGGASGSASSGEESSSSGPAVPSCPASLFACGADCVNTSNDPHHCGACGHDCEGQPCAGGVCAPVTLSADEGESLSFIAVHKGFVYFTNDWGGTVRRVSVSGGDSVTIAADQIHPAGIAADDHFVYWAVGGESTEMGAVRKAPLDGGTATTVAKGLLNPWELVVTPHNIIWMNWDYDDKQEHQRTLMRSGLDTGGPPSTFLESGDDQWSIGRADGDVFAIRSDGTVLRIPVDGGDPVPNMTAPRNIRSVTVGRDALYFTSWGSGSIERIALEGGDPVVFYDGKDNAVSSISGIVVDDTYLYWCEDYNGIIRKAPIAGGPSTLLAIGQTGPQRIVVDDKYAYWVNWRGSVMKTPK